MSQYQSFGAQLKQFRFRCRTLNRWLTGSISGSQRRLVDHLNGLDERGVLLADELVLDVCPDVLRTDEALSHANISTSAILFAIPLEDSPRPPNVGLRSSLVRKRIRAGIGPYEVVGDVYLQPSSKIRDVLLAVSAHFIVVSNAEIRQVGDPSFAERHEAVLINRHNLDFVGLETPSE